MFEYFKAFLLFCAVTIVSAIVVMKVSMYTGGEKVVVPDVQGKRIIPALEALDERGLYLKVTRLDFDPATPKNKIISQDPEPGEPLKTGRDVKVIVSRGSKETLAPDLVGATVLRAETILNRNSLKVGKKITVHSASAQKGIVMGQKPPAQTIVRRGDSLTLLVSAGPFTEYLMAPDFIDEPLSSAMENMKSMDLKISRVAYRPDNEKDRGIVISQEPGFGERVARGSFISLTVSEGYFTDSSAGPATFTFLYYTIPDGPSAVNVSIIQDNTDGEKEVYNRIHRPGDTVSLLLEIKGRTSAKIFINDELAEVKRF